MPKSGMGQVRAVVRGVEKDFAELDKIEVRVDRATLKAIKAAQNTAKASVKSGMRGRPRWDKRGAIGRNKTVPAVNLNLTPHHVSKSGGPGSLTGHLRSAVGGVKRPKRKGRAGYTGGVGVGGPKSITLLYRNHIEGDYPFMRPGVKKAEAKMEIAWARAWAKAVHK